ncbi:MAG TPA: cytochrome C oxidase subunit IV family protein [Lentimicrobium sp.]|nr:cytochrome C oxidase subunit IV family protein [Lentimicrobium sp.]
MSNTNPHITHISSYKDHLMVLVFLITLTIITVAITSIELSAYNVVAALIIASIKATIVLLYFMHLKFDQKIYLLMTVLVLALIASVIGITLFDYIDR